jgi:hypothetical protein
MKFFPAVLAMAILMIACSSGTPVDPSDSTNLFAVRESGFASPVHQLAGLFLIKIDKTTHDTEVVPCRSPMLHLNLVDSLNDTMGVSARVMNAWPPNYFNVEISLTNPYSMENLSAFDVKGIFIAPANKTMGPFIIPGDDDSRLLNPDGFTRWWNPTEFPYAGFFGYTNGILGSPSSGQYSGTIHPYKLFSNSLGPDDPVLGVLDVPLDDDAGRAVFRTDSKNSRIFELFFRDEDDKPILVFNYAVDISWKAPTQMPPQVPDEFPIEANQPEAFNIEITETANTLAYNSVCGPSGQLALQVKVWDWQGISSGDPAGQISHVRVWAPDIFPGPLSLEFSEATDLYAVYDFNATDINNIISVGLKTILVEVGTEGNYTYKQGSPPAPNEQVCAYQTTSVMVADNNKDAADEVEPNNSIAQATPLSVCQIGNGALADSADDHDYWVFSADEELKISICWRLVGGEFGWFNAIYLLDSEGDCITSDVSEDNGYFLIDGVFIPPGEYYLELYQSDESCSYEVWIEAVKTPELDESEPNNFIAQANPMLPGPNYTGILCDIVDNYDYWSFTLDNPTEFKFWWHLLDGEFGYFNNTHLLDPNGESIENDSGNDNGYFEIGPEFLPPGQYYAELYQSDESCYYEIWIESDSIGDLDESEPNDFLAHANPMVADVKYKGILCDVVDVYDYWKFALDSSYEIDAWWHLLDGEFGYFNTIYLLDSDGDSIDNDSSDDNGYFNIGPVFLPAGQYYLALYQSDESCKYEVWYETE